MGCPVPGAGAREVRVSLGDILDRGSLVRRLVAQQRALLVAETEIHSQGIEMASMGQQVGIDQLDGFRGLCAATANHLSSLYQTESERIATVDVAQAPRRVSFGDRAPFGVVSVEQELRRNSPAHEGDLPR
jgi:hypothetical protein